MDDATPTEPDDIRRPRHKMHGKRGTWFELINKKGIERNWIWQLRGDNVIRGDRRSGIKAKDFVAEAVISNEKTSPLFEVPRVVVETMRFDVKALRGQDVPIFWYLFAQARFQGIGAEEHVVSIQALKDYLGTPRRDRILKSLDKLMATEMSLHVNMPGIHGRKSMPMILSVEVDDDTVRYSLPAVLRKAVLWSRDYTWVDINAIARFHSKFTAAVYIKTCYEAGLHRSRRSNIVDTLDRFRARLGLPEGTQASVLADTIDRVREDLLAIDGPRRRFNITFVLEEGYVVIECNSSAKKLKEIKPRPMTVKSIRQVARMNSGPLAVPPSRWPSLVRLRQAATLLGTSVFTLADAWKLDVFGAAAYPETTFIGMLGDEFIKLIDEEGADEVLETWLDKREFPELGGRRVVEGVGVEKSRKRKMVTIVTVTPASREPDVFIEDLRLGDEVGLLEYGIAQPPAVLISADIDDMDIPF